MSSTHGSGTASFKCQVALSLEVLVCATLTVMDGVANGLCSVSSVDVGMFAGRHVPFMMLRHRRCYNNVALRDVGIHKVFQFCRRLRAVARHRSVVHKWRVGDRRIRLCLRGDITVLFRREGEFPGCMHESCKRTHGMLDATRIPCKTLQSVRPTSLAWGSLPAVSETVILSTRLWR